MAILGASPGREAQRELLGCLKLTAVDEEFFMTGLHDLTAELTSSRNGVQLLDATSLWLSQLADKNFVGMAQKTLNVQVKKLPANVATINAWCSDVTHGMIPVILRSIAPNTTALLLNAVYFKGTWTEKFNERLSKPGSFYSLIKGVEQEVPCTMMYRRSKMVYGNYRNTQIVELPYGSGGRFAATVLMPTGGMPLSDVVTLFGTEDGASKLNEYLSHTSSMEINLKLPRFKLEYGVVDLSSQLQSDFGVHEPFNCSIPDMFDAMSSDKHICVSALLHKAAVEVNEKGTRAAAVTAVEFRRFNMPSFYLPPPWVVIDHPFIFLIRDTRSKLLLFAGVVENPDFHL